MTSWRGRTVLITGGTGSLGSAVAQLLLAKPIAALRIFSRDEHKQEGLRRHLSDERVRFLLGDVRDLARLRRALAGVDLVVHAAALKRVEALEYNAHEAIATNIAGSQNVVEAAIDCRVAHVVAISTDKAVAPANLYGATKLVAEYAFLRPYSGVRGPLFSVLRLGNLWDSRGAVVERWRTSRPLQLTDPRCTRFWLRRREAAQRVMRILEIGQAGLVVPVMACVRMIDVLEAVAPGEPYELIGLRAGEKLHELDGAGGSSDAGPFLTVEQIRADLALEQL